MNIFKLMQKVSLAMAVFLILAAIGAWSWVKWEYHLPSEQRVRQQFENRKADYVRFVSLLQKDPSASFIGNGGNVDIDGAHSRVVPEYRELIRNIGAKFVLVRKDGSVEFALWGFGCAICSDSYMGIRYVPDHIEKPSKPGWTQIVVASLDSTKLPHESGSVSSGLYVVPVESKWFIYRLEVQE